MALELLRRHHEGVEILTINRPDVRNAIDLATAQALSTALDECEEDPKVRVIILTATGDRAFSSGMDLKAFARGEFPNTDQGFAGITQRRLTTPLIGVANGSALAGGFEILLCCDLIVAAEHALFGLPEPRRGLIAGAGGLVRLPRRVPRALAMEIALVGEPITAQRAYEIGLINRVVPAGDVMTAAFELAALICRNAPLSVVTSKQVLTASLEVSESDAWSLNDVAFNQIAASADALEGAISFVEKRRANWRGE